jgi:hypothetical protein
MRPIGDGTVIDDDQGTHARDAMQRAGIDADDWLKDVGKNPAKNDSLLERNEEMQKDDTAGHTGVPLLVPRQGPRVSFARCSGTSRSVRRTASDGVRFGWRCSPSRRRR